MFNVLTIDDDPAITELLSMLLKSHGWKAHVANTGEEGIRLIPEICPDVVILDLMMPGMDGWQVCKQVRTFSNVPILVLSALDAPRMVTSALDAGADDYLVKPVPVGVLVAHLNTLTRRPVPELNKQDMLKVKSVQLPF
jgi:DNA-binding response OmpR family regulator